MKSLFVLFICVACLAACQKEELVPVPGTSQAASAKDGTVQIPKDDGLVPMPGSSKTSKSYTPMRIAPHKD